MEIKRYGRVSVLMCLVMVSACQKQTDTGNSNAGGGSKDAAASSTGMSSGKQSGMQSGNRNAREVAVITQTLQPEELVDETEALGTSKANESVDITAKATNRVELIHFKEGQYVKRGDVLIEFDGTEARANLASTQATLRDTESQYKRSRELFASKALSESDLVQLEAKMLASKAAVEAAQARVNDTVIRAPFGGRMGLRNVSVGALVTPGQVITTLDDTSVIKLDFTVPETFVGTLKEGQQVEARTAAYDSVFRGRVSTIGSRVDPVSRSLVVRALIDNSGNVLKPGMFMTVHLVRYAGKALMVPEQALLPDAERQFVFVVDQGTARKVPVTIGRRKPGQVEVRKGLRAGDVIVVEGGDKLTDGGKVKVVSPTAES